MLEIVATDVIACQPPRWHDAGLDDVTKFPGWWEAGPLLVQILETETL